MNDKITKLPKDWKWVKLKDICEVVTGTTPPKSDMSNYGNEIPFFKPPHLWDGLISSTDEMLSSKGATKARVVPPNTVLVTCIGNLGRTGFVKKEAAFNQQINAILENDKIDGKYIFYQAQSPTFRKQLEKLATGTTVSIVNKGNFETINIPLAPLESQQAIVSKIEELFSELDKGIEDLKTAQLQLKTYRQSILKWAFEGKLTNENVKDGELPKGWEKLKLDKVADISSSKRIFQHEYVTDGVPFYRTKEVKELSEGKVLSIELFISSEKYEEIKSKFKIPQIGDILLSAVGTIGISYVIKDEKPFYFKDGNLMWFRDLKGINSYYLHYGLTNFIRNGQDANISGSAYNALTISTMKDFDFPIPTLEEQHLIIQEIESRLSVADKMEESIAQSLRQAEALRQSILKKAFSGELV
ncbi:restriction endonuclease subunit S [Flavobacterium macrobrachii]|uniref:restriction endonuclease subunit S n=1 Tax=Flavobacterium macrobrachii TaxID=591204 RepID=UPI003F72D1FB